MVVVERAQEERVNRYAKNLDRCVCCPGRIQIHISRSLPTGSGIPANLPGFVEGFLHEKIEGSGRFNVVTTAVWESEAAYEYAKKATAGEFKKTGFNPQEMMKRLKIEVERAVYHRSPY